MNLSAPSLAEIVESAAMELVHRHSLDEIEGVLVASGIAADIVAKAVLLIPSAFAAVKHEPEGIWFPSEFSVGPPERLRKLPYSGEPLYQEARYLAERWLRESHPSLVGRVLDWSAEQNAIKEVRSKGLHPSRMAEIHHGEWWA